MARSRRRGHVAHAHPASLRLRIRRSGLAAMLRGGIGPALSVERTLPVGVAALVFAASILSFQPAGVAGGVGGTTGRGEAPRIAIGGQPAALDGEWVEGPGDYGTYPNLDFEPIDPENGLGGPGDVPGGVPVELPDPSTEPDASPAASGEVSGPFLSDGTLITGFAPDTTVEDGAARFQTYKVRSGDTLVTIARKFQVTMMTIWWANDLQSKDDLHVGQVLTIPPVSGVVVVVGESDTLESLATKYKSEAKEILAANGLEEPNLVIGQTLIIPGALGKGIATPKPTPRPTARPGSGSGSSSKPSVKPPTTYGGGRFSWPVVGGGNHISQYFHYGHYGIDIAADYGSRVRAAAGGRVIFAGWKSNGGGYQVWIAHGSGLYSTYNHMSGVSVGVGQTVSKGQAVGRIGCTGYCTGPHLHFEVWRGPVWNGGYRVNPLIYL